MDAVLGLVRHAGNDALFQAVEMSLVAAAAGLPLHVHAEGLRGTGKTSIMRAVRPILPRIRRIRGCLYNCDPARPHCPQHRGLTPEEVARLGVEEIPMPFLEISHSAKVGTVVGSIDLARLVSPAHPEAALLPGTLPQAHRGILFVDEINRLAETAPELADVLLDVMGTKPGRVQIEETGLAAVELPVQVTIWAASNPDEDPGPLEEIRRQLSDRFDLVVYADRPGDVAVVEQILSAGDGSHGSRPFPGDPEAVRRFRTELIRRAELAARVQVPAPLRQQIAELYSRFQVESLRAVQAIQAGVRLSAALEGREEAGPEDLARVAPLALRHRMSPENLRRAVAHLAGLSGGTGTSAASTARIRQPSLSLGGAVPASQQGLGNSDDFGGEGRLRDPARGPGYEGDPESAAGGAPAGSPSPEAEGVPKAGNPEGREDRGWLARALSRFRGRRQPDGVKTSAGGGSPEAGPAGGRAASAGAAVSDPLKHPVVAPVHPARPIRELAPDELVRTEEELGGP